MHCDTARAGAAVQVQTTYRSRGRRSGLRTAPPTVPRAVRCSRWHGADVGADETFLIDWLETIDDVEDANTDDCPTGNVPYTPLSE